MPSGIGPDPPVPAPTSFCTVLTSRPVGSNSESASVQVLSVPAFLCAVATINAMEDEGMVANAARIGSDVLGPGLRELAHRHPSVGEVRGLGVFWAIELVADQRTREPLAPYGGSSAALNAVVAACKSGGLLPFSNYNRIHAVPPCNVSDDEVAEGLRILDAALTVADGYVR